MGSLQILCLLTDFLGTPVSLIALIFPKVPWSTFVPNLSKFITFAAAPLVLTPFVRNQLASEAVLSGLVWFCLVSLGLAWSCGAGLALVEACLALSGLAGRRLEDWALTLRPISALDHGVRDDPARQHEARRGEARRGEARRGEARRCATRLVDARLCFRTSSAALCRT